MDIELDFVVLMYWEVCWFRDLVYFNIVWVYDMDCVVNLYFMVMEYFEGDFLLSYLWVVID